MPHHSIILQAIAILMEFIHIKTNNAKSDFPINYIYNKYFCQAVNNHCRFDQGLLLIFTQRQQYWPAAVYISIGNIQHNVWGFQKVSDPLCRADYISLQLICSSGKGKKFFVDLVCLFIK